MTNIDVVKTAMFGKQIQSNDVNDAMAEYVAEHIASIPTIDPHFDSVWTFAEDIRCSIELENLNKEQKTAILLLLGSENFQLLSKDDYSRIHYKIDNDTYKVFFDVQSKEEFQQEAQVPETFMNLPEGYKEEPIKPIDEKPYAKEHIHPNRAYLEHIIEIMKPHMPQENPTMEDYCLAAPKLLPTLLRG